MPKPSLHVIRGCYECPLRDRDVAACDHPEAPETLRVRYDPEPPPPGCPLRTSELRIALSMSADLRVGEREAAGFSDVVARDMARGTLPGVRRLPPEAERWATMMDGSGRHVTDPRGHWVTLEDYEALRRAAEELAALVDDDRLRRVERALLVMMETTGSRIPMSTEQSKIVRAFLDGIGAFGEDNDA